MMAGANLIGLSLTAEDAVAWQDKIDQTRNHVLDERHIASPLAGGAVAVTKVVLHVDDDQHAML